MKLLIGLLACQEYKQRRQLCRSTWLSQAPSHGLDYVFLIGGHDRAERRGDELWLPVGDQYYDLPKKTKAFCEWVDKETDFTHVWKADDDTYCCIPRFAWWLEHRYKGQPYVGNEWDKNTKYASGGAGYLLDRTAIQAAAKDLNTRKKYEDLEMGKVMRRHHIPFTIDNHFIAFGNDVLRPLPDNRIISTHKISDELWMDCWEKLKDVQ